MLGADVMNVRH